jgi:hypothetical protein
VNSRRTVLTPSSSVVVVSLMIAFLWLCVLSGPDGARSAGVGLTPHEAAADAWVCSWPLSQMIDCIMGRAAPPAPDGRWRFELAPPGCWERVRHTVAARNAPRATGRG